MAWLRFWFFHGGFNLAVGAYMMVGWVWGADGVFYNSIWAANAIWGVMALGAGILQVKWSE